MAIPVILHMALHPEARPLIAALDAKKARSTGPFGLFVNEAANLHILVSGMGRVRTAAGLGFACERIAPGRREMHIVNIGLAGALDLPVGTLCTIERVIDRATEHSFYPDLLVPAPGTPVTVETHDCAVTQGSALLAREHIADMEASAVFEAGPSFCSSSRLQSLKVISDSLACTIPSKQCISDLIEFHTESICNYVERLQHEPAFANSILNTNDMETVQQIARQLSLTATQQAKLCTSARYYKVRFGELPPTLISSINLPPRDKQHRNALFNSIQARLDA